LLCNTIILFSASSHILSECNNNFSVQPFYGKKKRKTMKRGSGK
jgi:hypothetical protein